LPLSDAAGDSCDTLTAFALKIHTASPECFADLIRRDTEKWGKLARDIGFKPH
jgi:hypothetical protein